MTAIRTVPSDQQGAEAADRLDTSGDQQTQSREDAVSSKVDDEKYALLTEKYHFIKAPVLR